MTRFSIVPIDPRRPLRSALLAAVALLAGPQLAAGHAELTATDPVANATLTEAPDSVRMSFSEPIDPSAAFVDLIDARQRPVEGVGTVAVSEDGLEASVSLPELPPGTYTVTYQVVSTVDGHATTGIFAFLVDPSGTEAPPAIPPGSTSPSVDGLTIAARWAALIGALVALGSLVMWWRAFAALASRSGLARRGPWLLVAAGAALAFLGIALYVTLAARPIADALSDRRTAFPLDLAAPFGWTSFAIAMRVALAGSVAAVVVALLGWRLARAGGRAPDRWMGAAAAVALAITLGAMSMAAHAAAAGGPAFALVDWLHLVAVAAWLGGLPAAVVLARRGSDRPSRRALAGAILRRHGAVALVAAPVVVLTGITNSPLVLGSGRDLVASDYGNLLLAKGGLVAAALAIGAVNHFALRGRGRANVAVLLAAELAVAALAVSIAATMVTIQPAAAREPILSAPPVNPAHLYGSVGPTSVHATVNLPTPGSQAYQVTVTDRQTGAPRQDVQRVFLELDPPPDAELPTERVELQRDGHRPDLYGATGAHMPVEGEWTLSIVVRRAGELDESVSFDVPVRPAPRAQLVPPPDTGIGVPAPVAVAWSILPSGPLGWAPAALAFGGIIVAGFVARRRPSPLIAVTRSGLVVILLFAAFGAGSRVLVAVANTPAADDLAAHAPEPGASLSTEAGRSIYLANCASCHGQDGAGDGPVRTLPAAGALAEPVARMSTAELSYRIAYGVAGTPMPAFAGTLTDVERWDLVAYLEDRWK